MIGIIYNNSNKQAMENELSSLKFQRIEDIELVSEDDIDNSYTEYDLLITDDTTNCNLFLSEKFILIIYNINQTLFIPGNIVMIQYESKWIKECIEKRMMSAKSIKSVVINRIPKQKLEINPRSDQDSSIFFHGVDKEENMVDQMFELDTETHYEIKYYDINDKSEPSKRHRLSWNVSTDENTKGILTYKIIKEIENGCLPILLKENAPKYLFAYPFMVSLYDLLHKEELVMAIQEISRYISKIKRDDFKTLANGMYNGYYTYSSWNYNFYLMSEEINSHIKSNRI